MGGWKSAVQLSVLLCCCLAAVQGQLTVTSLPAVLFNETNQRIVEDSVVWLYCEVNSTESTLTVTWNKDSVPLVQDVPHIRIRNFTSDTSTTFLLVVDDFQASDNGTYQCTAQDTGATANGTALTLTAYNSSTDGSLRIVARTGDDTDSIPDNRTGYQMGDTATLSFEIGHVGDDSTPSVMWLKDGTPVRATPTNTPGINGRITTTLSFTFQESDAGVYQCVITGNNSELLATIPIRLDTGETHTIERVSPSSIIILRPPDKLVLEVRATGQYTLIQWRRNGAAFGFLPSSAFRVMLFQELPNFFEIFVREPTTKDDLGVFTAELSPPVTTTEVINFAVIGAVDASTIVNGGASVVTVSEGGSVNISCTSTGVPAPTITWRLNNQATPFNQTDMTTTADIRVNNNFAVDSIINGSVVSTLHIVNAQYPAHDGVYECIGDNSNGGSAPPSIANITLQVQVPVSFTDPLADVVLVNETENENVTINCSALGVPEPSIVWSPSTGDISSSSTMTDEGISVSSTLTISNIVRSDAGSYTCNVSNTIPSSITRTFNISVRFPPSITMSPSSIALLRPAALSLTCTANGVPAPTFTWIRTLSNGSETEFSMDSTDIDGRTLTITNNSPSGFSMTVKSVFMLNSTIIQDTANYSCMATNELGSVNSSIAQVLIYAAPSISSPTEAQRFQTNEQTNIIFTCMAYGLPAPSLSFQYEGDVLNRTDGVMGIGEMLVDRVQVGTEMMVLNSDNSVYDVTRTLTLFNAVDGDTGNFTCLASVNIPDIGTRMDTVTFELTVLVRPSITTPPMSQVVVAGMNVSLSCVAEGLPRPSITWFIMTSERVELDAMNYDIQTRNGSGQRQVMSTLSFVSVQPITANAYFCNASNVVGDVVTMANLTVHTVPEIEVFPENLIVDQFQMATFECSATGIPAPAIRWFRSQNGTPIELLQTDPNINISDPVQIDNYVLSNGRGLAFVVNSSLILLETSDSNNGLYVCVAINVAGNDTGVFQLTVQVAANITDSPQALVVTAPNPVTFSCTASGLPRPNITWSDPSSTLLMSGSGVTITEMRIGERVIFSTLNISMTVPSNSGNYTCVADNGVTGQGDLNRVDATLSVHVTPEVTSVMNYTVNLGDIATFQCVATGIPVPTITWFRGGVESNESNSRVMLNAPSTTMVMSTSITGEMVYEVTRTLTLIMSRDEDSGTYQCRATNAAMPGMDTMDFELIVQIPPATPTIRDETALTVTQPASATFICIAVARPRPSITWYRVELDNSRTNLTETAGTEAGVTITTENGNTETELNSTLLFDPTRPSFTAEYVCEATNPVNSTETSVNLTVHVSPEVTSVMNYTVDLGNTATFQCVATGIPAPTITWFRGGVELNESNSRVMLNASSTTMVMSTSITGEMVYEVTRTLTLSMSRDEDSGTYQCRATNAAMPGMDTMDFELIVQIPPATPTITDEAALIVTQPAFAMFVCTAMARPRPSITWYRVRSNNSRTNLTGTTEIGVTITTMNGNMERDIRSTLLFNLTRPSFTAIYVCVATNPAGSAETNASLTVHVTPEVTSVMNYTVDLGDTATFQCVATGIPAPTITWFRGGVELNASDSQVTFNAPSDPTMVMSMSITGEMVYQVNRTLTLSMSRDEDSGTYQCRATNAAMPGIDTMDFTLTVQIPPIPTIRDEAPLIVTEPASAMFICIAVARPRPSIMWYKVELDDSRTNLTETAEVEAGVTITTVNGNTERETQSTLLFDPTRPSFTAEYVCEATNPVDSAETSVNLTVHVTPEVISVYPDPSQMNYTVNLGNTATFQCVATGIPAPTITWFRGGVELNASDPRVTFNTPSNPIMVNSTSIADSEEMVYQVTRTLTLNMSRDEDSGTYQCRATNAAMPDNDTMDFELIVQIPPATPNITNQRALTVTEPAPATFICTAVARPRPSIRWYRVGPGATSHTVFNGTDNGVTIATVNGNTDRETQSTLLFNHTRPSFTAIYICEATNPVASAETNASLTVHVTPEVTNVYPDPSQMNYTVNLGNTATFQCVATGIPTPTITWLKGGVELNASDPRVTFNAPSTTMVMSTSITGEMVYQVNRTLTLSMSRDEDSGTYQCRATNAAMPGMDAMDFELIVQIPPATPNIRDEAALTVTQPASAMFICIAMARPRPSIRWYRVELNNSRTNLAGTDDGVTITTENGNTEREINSTLLFDPTRPSFTAEYVCEATNPVDRAETSVNLTVHVNPNITVFLPDGDSRYVVNMSDSAIFQCNATGVPPPLIQWFRGQELLNMSTDTRITLSDPYVVDPPRELATVGRTLTIRDTVNNDTGSYSCRASNAAEGRMDTETFELFIQVPPQVVPLNNDQRVIANESTSAVLRFRIDQAAPQVETSDIRWYYTARAPSGTPDFTSSNFQNITDLMNRTSRSMLSFSSNRFSLNISNIVQARQTGEETDAGRYFMRASNPAGEDSDYIELIVFGRPQIVEGPQDQFAINNGSSAVFTCNAIAFPLHNISWSFRNFTGSIFDKIVTTDSVSDTEKYSIVRDRNGTFGQLTVMNVLFQDRGTYICEAMNEPGNEFAQANLTVHVIPIVQQISSPNDTLLTESVAIFCLATGYPIPTFTWQKGGGNIDNTDTNDRIDIFSFFPRLDSETTDFESELMMNDSISELLMMNTDISVNGVLSLGELGIVSVLNINSVVREDTDNYTCTIRNQLPQTTTITRTSNPVPLLVLERPDPPINATTFMAGSRWIALRWTPTFDGNRPVFGFLIYISNVNISQNFTQVADLVASNLMTRGRSFMFNISGGDTILPFTRYSFRVVSCNEIGSSDQSESSPPRQTGQDTATAPLNLATSAPTNSSLTLTWSPPQTPNGIVTAYNVSYTGRKSYNTSFSQVGFRIFDAADLNGAVLGGLTPGTDYSLTVAAINEAGTGMSSQTAVCVTESVPPPPPIVPTLPPELIMSSDDGNPLTIVIPVPNFSTENGPISHYQIVVVIIPEGQTLSDLPSPSSVKTMDPYSADFCDQNSPTPVFYVTVEFGENLFPPQNHFIVGIDKNTDSNSPNDRPNAYTNGPLCYSKSYTFFIRAFNGIISRQGSRQAREVSSQRQYESSTSTSYIPQITTGPPPPPIGIAVGVVIAVLVVIIVIVVVIIVVILVYRRYSDKTDYYEPTEMEFQKNGGSDAIVLMEYVPPEEGSDVRQPVPLTALSSHVDRMHLNENCGFGEEYRIIQDKSPKKPVEVCISPDNKPRNRYANIQCFDETRVILKPVEGAEHDYINASFIEGYNRKREYIAAQGPLPDTLGDFWRMVWEYNVPTVIMLTNLVEKAKVKCSQYWPNKGTIDYGNISVTLINTVTHADFVLRQFTIKNKFFEEVKEVRQYHFISWPDFGVPRHATPLLYFLRRVRNSHKYSNQKPMIVHCSAGVGRTGTFITIDMELQRAEGDQCMDPFNTVKHMRQERNHMVQTEAQYIFLHDAILEGVNSGKTEVPVDQLNKRMKILEEVDKEDESGYKKEFLLLRQFKVNVREFTDANDDANKFKNRLANALPYNYNRVHLQMRPGIGGSDYINASYIDGYAKKGTYIATQGPLRNTVGDFWRMIWEGEVNSIVMLTQLEEKGKVQSAQYWPSTKDSPEKMDEFMTELVSEGAFEDYVVREIKLTQATSGKTRTVKHFHFLSWPENGAPASGAGMVDLIDQVTRTQQRTGDKPIVVHCSAGIGRTGAFCALSTAIEKLKAEQMVDVFHTIKHLRTQRPHMVQNVDQYIFCYRAIREYVDSQSNYMQFQSND